MGLSAVTYALSKKYTDESLIGMGALKGAPCKVKSVTKENGQNVVTLSWTDDLNVEHESKVYIKDGTPIYTWTPNYAYAFGDLAIYESCFYRCTTPNADAVFDDTKWGEINSPDGNFDIVNTASELPATFTPVDKKMYFVIDEGIFYFWNGTEWIAQGSTDTFIIHLDNPDGWGNEYEVRESVNDVMIAIQNGKELILYNTYAHSYYYCTLLNDIEDEGIEFFNISSYEGYLSINTIILTIEQSYSTGPIGKEEILPSLGDDDEENDEPSLPEWDEILFKQYSLSNQIKEYIEPNYFFENKVIQWIGQDTTESGVDFHQGCFYICKRNNSWDYEWNILDTGAGIPIYTQGAPEWDTVPTQNSTKAITSGGVYQAISDAIGQSLNTLY